ncbi:CASP-like protein 2A2 [Raphanus sativus]|uniref:CASP-like protein n=1 Tax=Raphanus sativus TaxID=3726 RepID=A0A9W3DSE3_RAPSA|nr:CASP-like protein 2A2 isoform X1 [Raphanus sativus]KAJ4893606.1 CASP-like protein 2A2 [Raphanus sativus]
MDKTDQNVNRTERTVETVLRVASMALSIASLVIMIKNSISNDFGSLSYSTLGAFKYLVNTNGVCATYSLLSAIFLIAIPCRISKPRLWTVFLLDQVVTYAVLAAGAVSAETVYLAYKGNLNITWSSACDYYGIFCHKALVSVILALLVSVLYVSLSFISSYRLFSRFEAPKQ